MRLFLCLLFNIASVEMGVKPLPQYLVQWKGYKLQVTNTFYKPSGNS